MMMNLLCKGDAVDNAAAEGNLVGVFEVVADGDTAGDGGDFDTQRGKLFVEIEGGGVAVHGGRQGQDDLVDVRGDALLDTLDEGIDIEVADADAVDRRDDTAQHVVEALVLLRVLDGHDVLHILHHTDDALVPFGAGADGTGVGVAEAVADVAVVDVGGEAVDSVGEQQHLVSRLFEQMEGETECGTLAYTRQRGEVFDGIGQGV